MEKTKDTILADRISEALDGNWANDNMGSFEELQYTQELLVDGLSVIIAMLINRKILNMKDIKDSLKRGLFIEGGD